MRVVGEGCLLRKAVKTLGQEARGEGGAGVEEKRAVVSVFRESVGKSIVRVSVFRETRSVFRGRHP